MNKIQKATSQKKTKNVRLLLMGMVAVLILVEVFFTQYTRYMFYVVKCGGMPVVAHAGGKIGFGGSRPRYSVPGSYSYSVGAGQSYYCSQEEAENAGYLPDILTEEGRQRQKEIDQQNES